MTEQRDTADDDAREERKTLPPRGESASPARLIVLAGSHPGRRLPLEGATTLGRDPERVDVCLDDLMISSVHARLEPTPAGWRIVDLGSRNGTYVNGARVSSAIVCFGDRVRMGHSLLLFSHHDALEEQLQARQKFEAIGRLGATVAHDLNNLFGAVVASADHLRSQLGGASTSPVPDPASCGECLDDIEAAMRRSADLVRRLLAFSKRTPRREAVVEISRLCEDAVHLIKRSLGEGMSMTVDVSPECTVRGDSTLLHQMILNLLVNARDATEARGGTIHVQLREKADARGDSATGSWVEIVVTDTGMGMDDATRRQMFEPFFTTKGPDRGTGLGLSIVMEAVAAHGGLVECHSRPGLGTSFSVRLPALSRGRARTHEFSRTAAGSTAPEARPAKILLADDEPVLRRGLTRLLVAAGHEVIEATNGAEALDLAVLTEGLDLAIIDLEMPIVNGRETLERLRRLLPELPVLVMTGACEPALRTELCELGAAEVLSKPLGSGELCAGVATVMSRRRQAA